jgi:tRNA(Ile)-lysidine synthase
MISSITLSIISNARKTIDKYGMLSAGDTVLAGLSGGPDSVCLLHVLKNLDMKLTLKETNHKALNLKLLAVYVDHGLRPDETPAEIEFCRTLCNKLGVEFMTRALPPLIEKGNKQDALRTLRYEVFTECAIRAGAKKIALGHNRDDQAETVLINLMRGAALAGLSGIPPVRGAYIRPLIDVSRADIEQYLADNNLEHVTDSSNLTDDYLRNRIRHNLLPHMLHFNPNLVDTLSRNAHVIREENDFLEFLTSKKLITLISRKSGDSIELFLSPLESMERVILRRVLKRATGVVEVLHKNIGANHIEDVLDLIKAGATGDRIHLPGGIRVIKSYSTLIITARPPSGILACELNVPGEAILREAKVVLRTEFCDPPDVSIDDSIIKSTATNATNNKYESYIDADKLKLPLNIRGRRNGDFFYPLGAGGRKKVQDFLVDEKIPRDERGAVPIVCSGEDIVWVAGMRLDDRFKVTGETRRCVRIELKGLRG